VNNMFYVYILKGDNKIYVGRTDDLKRRINEHFKNKVWTTKRLGKLELIYYEAFKDKIDSIRREKYLKTTKGKRALKLMLKASLK